MESDNKTSPSKEFVESSGNVFADLEFADADERLAKAKLAARIAAIIEERNLSQTDAAGLLDVDQPKISALVRGRLEGFSTERLFRFLNALGAGIEIRVLPDCGDQAGVRVLSA